MEFKKGDIVYHGEGKFAEIVFIENFQGEILYHTSTSFGFEETELTLVCRAEDREDGKERP